MMYLKSSAQVCEILQPCLPMKLNMVVAQVFIQYINWNNHSSNDINNPDNSQLNSW